tara:strand:- start:1307 stop:1438 length:132 start_codon:yes stop_codon:yes gene_type:complete
VNNRGGGFILVKLFIVAWYSVEKIAIKKPLMKRLFYIKIGIKV